MEESQSQSHSQSLKSSVHEHQTTKTTPSELRLCSSNVESHVICSSAGDANSDAGFYSGAGSNCAKYKLMSPAKLPISRSPCVTIPPGLSPTSFLESPVLLSNMKAEPSPTTGSFFKPHLMHGSSQSGVTAFFSLTANCSNNDSLDERKTSCFEFNPHTGCNSISRLSAAGPVISSGLKHPRSEVLEQFRSQFQPQSFGSLSSVKSEMEATPKELSPSAPVLMAASGDGVRAGVDSDVSSQRGPTNTGVQASQSDHNDVGPSVTAERSSDDGYNWRKYGQKLVKGCEFPRSYYKCTHPNCEVKKIFERSHDGHISEIVYKGAHDHPKPQPTRRFTTGASMSVQEKTENFSSLTGLEDNSSIKAQISHNLEPNDTPELSPRGVNDDGNCTNDEVDEDDPFSKRRKIDGGGGGGGGGVDVTAVVKPIREPRVVVQTVSEVDILDDGYRWRKYGQKVVRGNPNPRSYYKCTNSGCPVRKHVERASHDPKAVITAYEGKHNHDVPTAKNSSHDMVGPPAMNGPSRIRAEVGDQISLDLGVGISSGAENRFNEQQHKLDTETLQSQIHSTNSSFKLAQMTPVSTYYGIINGGSVIYGSRENHIEGSNPPSQNLGRVLLGP